MHTKNKILVLFILINLTIATISSVSADNGNTDDGNLILLKAGHINTDNATEPEEQNNGSETQGLSTMSMEDTENYYIVQFTGPVRASWKQEITSTGATIYNYIPNNAFIFKMSDNVKVQVQSLDFVKWIGEYKPEYKYEPELTYTNSIQIASTEIDTENTYHVLLFYSEDYDSIASSIELLGGKIISGSGNILKVQIATNMLPEIASINGVSWIEEYVQPTVNNDIAANITNANTVHETYRLNGSGQIVAIADTGLDTGVNDSSMHADLRGRIKSIIQTYNDGSSADYAGHGTHVAGSVLGNGSLSGGQYRGIAPEAELVFQALGDNNGSSLMYIPDDLNDLFQEAYDLGARIHTNSWGGASNGAYTVFSLQVDQFTWEHPDMLILFSAGNSGTDADGDGVIDEDSIAYPATAKNCLTVGASENDRGDNFGQGSYQNWGFTWSNKYPESPIYEDYMANDIEGIAAFSSRGPTEDGRIKPDVVAPGTFIISTRSSLASGTGWGTVSDNSNYLYMGGTSMSTPITAGSAALVREYYTEIENLSSPSAALLKATIINGAMDLTPGQYGNGSTQEIEGRPDYSQGWGRVDIENSIYPQYPETIRYFDDPKPLNTGDFWNVSYDILNSDHPLRVTLVWTDYPGDAAAELQLVNNLDLKVVGPDDTYNGNGRIDTVNNVEGVELTNPSAGTYTFIVNGTDIPQGPQNFSLVLYFAADVNEYPQNDSYITDSTTAVSVNLTHPHGINISSIDMTTDGTEVLPSWVNITGGYKVENITTYSEGYHTVSVSALTNLSEEISYGWRFYASVEDNVITIEGLAENSVIQEETLDINVSNRKLCDFWYNVDNGTNSTTETGFSFNTTLNLTEGRHNLTVFAEDITGYINSTTVNFTVFTSQPIIDSPESGTIYYLPEEDSFTMNGTAGVATNVSVYVNGNITTESWPVSSGVFNISNIPLSNGTNTVNITSIFNNSVDDYFSPNTTIYLGLGETFNTGGNDEVTLAVPGIETGIVHPVLNFNISGTPANPGNVSAAIVTGNEPENSSNLTGHAIDIKVINASDANYSYQFGRNVSLTLGYNHSLVNGNSTGKLVVAWYNPEEEMWIPFRSTVNTSEHTVTANITHLSIYAPLEDNTAPVISDLTNSSTLSSITLTWSESDDTDHVEIWKNNAFLENSSEQLMADTGLSSSTSYNYSLRAIDFAGNIGNWSNMTVATSLQASTPSNPSSSGGGGGGGGSTGEEYENIAFKDVLSVYAGKGDIVYFDFDNENNDIDYVRYNSLKNAGKISTTIEILKNTSTFADSPVSGLIYRNMNIWVGKTGYATEGNVKDPVIGFRVSKKWIENNDIDPATIALNRYNEENWEMLDTKQNDPDDNYLYFEASTQGFSPFAITAQEPLTKNTDDIEITVTDMSDSAIKDTDTDTDPRQNENDGARKIPAISGMITMMILAITCVFIRKQQN
ncbi:PGF-pre-PGF domain-containing protein [Methanolobus mangrovi]|uniref:PGF-pre-PGF domain-containing protein n=1 Tax=Methanolobus mangrovi TaxID=3072977 RepID=A0AA51UDQ2_9EURY|nr:PGF-pre-PGF domain-containing protein [Methanolobus mangrovi]WMW21084.1 PGF-pre-PGF domain-containing protein [Methanolobus mangrovi]